MKKLLTLFLLSCATFSATFAQKQSPIPMKTLVQAKSNQSQISWYNNKYSMFIHFGLYSELGGVWEGKPVTRGYSEQIQSFAGIFSDWYGDTALRFNPTLFNADSIVALAKEAGMRSIVFTTKHHDGFCMFRTATTDYNSYDATPEKRDFVKELSEACKRGGINFAMYYSLIDWHFPQAYPISSHNCDFITPQHHEFSKAQVTELLTNYGPISELWFDMGSNTPEQSQELYELVHKLQPNCMVSGRLGNDRYDFAVMADNKYPEGALQTAWQSAASMFDETWSYRSWQERGDVHKKAAEKLRSLINVVSHGGNFLLNIGPKGDGSVVPFESEVLKEIGAWLSKNGDAIYGTNGSPFREQFEWGVITRKNNKLNLILSGTYPQKGEINLYLPGYKLESSTGNSTNIDYNKGKLRITVPETVYNSKDIEVLTLIFDKEIQNQTATSHSRVPNYSYSCFDYYSNYRSIPSYQWEIPYRKSGSQIEITYTAQEAGKELVLTNEYLYPAGDLGSITLNAGKAIALNVAPQTTWGKRYLCGPGTSVFDGASTMNVSMEKAPVRNGKWKETDAEQKMFPSNILETYFVMQEVYSPKTQDVLVDVGAGNGIEVYLNGKSVMKHLNPYRCKFREEKVLLHLEKGNNQILLRLYNRFEKETGYLLRPSAEQVIYKQKHTLPGEEGYKQGTIGLKIKQEGLPTQHTDTELHNISIK